MRLARRSSPTSLVQLRSMSILNHPKLYRFRFQIVLLCVLWSFFSCRSHCETVELFAVRDSSLYEPESPFDFNSAEANKSNGTGDHLFAGRSKQNVTGFIRRLDPRS